MRTLSLVREVWRQHSTGLPRTIFQIWSEHRCAARASRTIDVFRRRPIDEFYAAWTRRYDTLTEPARDRMRAEIASWRTAPQISVIMPVRNADPGWLKVAIQSVRAQLYPGWELCLCA